MTFNLLMLSIDGYGHTYPQLPLAKKLVDRGHHVTYICSSQFREAIEKTGALWVQSDPEYSPIKFTNPKNNRAERFAQVLIDNAKSDLAVYRQRLAAEEFDAVLYDTFSLAGPILGKDTVQVQLWASAVTPAPASGKPETFPLKDRLNLQAIEKFYAEYGIENRYPSLTLSETNIAFYPAFFLEGAKKYPHTFHFIGPSIGPRPHDASWTLPDDPRPLIYISLGTVFNYDANFFRQCIAAVSDGKYQVIIALGNAVTREDLPEIPENVTVAPYFPQTAILEHADLFISHGGMASCMEGLYFNTPFLLNPQQAEQEYNSNRLVSLGVGKILPTDYTAESIRAAIDEVMSDPEYHKKSTEYSRKIKMLRGVAEGADIVENAITWQD